MKKTLITLLAFGSAAFGETTMPSDANYNLGMAIHEYGYNLQEGFMLHTIVTLPQGSGKYFTFSDDWLLFSQERKYFGVTTEGDPGGWPAVGGSATTEPYTEPLVIGQAVSSLTGPTPTTTVVITLSCTGMSVGDNVTYNTSLRVSTRSGISTDSGITLIDSVLLDANEGYTAFFDLRKVEFETNVVEAKLIMGGNPQVIDLVNYTSPVPEPTTATLSLLALAGLAARRRRK